MNQQVKEKNTYNTNKPHAAQKMPRGNFRCIKNYHQTWCWSLFIGLHGVNNFLLRVINFIRLVCWLVIYIHRLSGIHIPYINTYLLSFHKNIEVGTI